MRHTVALGIIAAALSGPMAAAGAAALDFRGWRELPVLDHGRYKPLDTLARETLLALGGRDCFVDQQTGERLEGTALYAAMLLEWQGWDRPTAGHTRSDIASHDRYFLGHEPDRWDRAPLLLVDSAPLRAALGMPAGRRYVAPLDVVRAKILDPRSHSETPFLRWIEKLLGGAEEDWSPLEKDAIGLAERLQVYQEHRMGLRLAIVPIPGSPDREWAPLDMLLRGGPENNPKLAAAAEAIRNAFWKARTGYAAGSGDDFREGTAALVAAARDWGLQLGEYPNRRVIQLEVLYNQFRPLHWAWILLLAAAVWLALAMAVRGRGLAALGTAAYVLAVAALLAGLAMRVAMAGRAPVTNMYESVVFVALGIAAIGLALGLGRRSRLTLVAAAAAAGLALLLAESCPTTMDPSIQPLAPVLRSNFWLVIHVLAIIISYAAFAVATVLAHVTLGYFLVAPNRRDTIAALGKATYKVIQAGVLLLTVGTALGAIWGDYSWGRFWGWDPKEVWALVTLLVYVGILHARLIGWVGHLGLAVLSILGFQVLLMAWYGVNFVLATGLHSYGFSGGGQIYVGAGVGLDLLLAAGIAMKASLGRGTT